MDLVEKIHNHKKRHPWELARVSAIKKILGLNKNEHSDLKLLDVGCGDNYIIRELMREVNPKRVDAVDINLSCNFVIKLSLPGKKIFVHNDFSKIKKNYYNLVLLLDVLEHIEHDSDFLYNIIRNYIKPNGKILITVPAYKILFSYHDNFLRHYRRYKLSELLKLAQDLNLEKLIAGYMFFSLIPIRLFNIFMERSFPNKYYFNNNGVGQWNGSKFITKLIKNIMTADFAFSYFLINWKIFLPGLTVWALFKKPL